MLIRCSLNIYWMNGGILFNTLFWETVGKFPFIRELTTWLFFFSLSSFFPPSLPLTLSFFLGKKSKGVVKWNWLLSQWIGSSPPCYRIEYQNNGITNNICKIIVENSLWFINYAYFLLNANKKECGKSVHWSFFKQARICFWCYHQPSFNPKIGDDRGCFGRTGYATLGKPYHLNNLT